MKHGLELAASVAAAFMVFTTNPALAANWVVDPAHSHFGFSGVQVGVPFKGEFRKFDAKISYDPEHPESAHVVVTIDMASAHTGDTQRDAALPQPEWFDTAKFPTATFEAAGFHPKGGQAWETPGKLSVRGIGRDVVLPFTLALNGDTAHATGHVQLVRTAFGVGQGAWSSGDWVALEVGVDLDLVVRKEGS
jgi:polyisoprenoid-binding protein YceI